MKRMNFLFKLALLSCLAVLFLPADILPLQPAAVPLRVEAASGQKQDPIQHVLNVGQGALLSISNTNGRVTWKSDNSSVVTVDKNGKITAKKAGKAVVTGKVEGYTFYYSFTVENPKLNYSDLTLEIGKSKTLKVTGTTSRAAFKVTDSKIAKVDKNGKVTALSRGYVSVYTYVNDGLLECRLKVIEPSLSEAVKTGKTEYLSAVNKKIAKKARKIIDAEITKHMTDIEKVKAVHDYIVLNTAYDYDNYLAGSLPAYTYTPEGVLLHGSAVCQGYAETFQLFMEALELPVRLIGGTAGGEGHAWNLVKADGKWYQVDTTWDDPVPDKKGFIRYDYFMLTDAIMGGNHKWKASDYPKCNSEKYLYYAYEDYIVDSVKNFKEKFMEQFEKGEKTITVLYPENEYPDWSFIWDYSQKWKYQTLTQKGKYSVLVIIIED